MIRLIMAVWMVLISLGLAMAADDILISDFEGKDYGAWKVEGESFGPGPARGTLPRQMSVEGYLGDGLANSFHGSDKSVGKLTSPGFKVERKFIRFLIGGGGFAGETCMNLLVDGKQVRTATGPNTAPGGSEALEWSQWDVSDLAGKQAVIEIVDARKGGWGHINVDHIIQSDKPQAPVRKDAGREFVIEKTFLNIPIKNGAPRRVCKLMIDGKAVRQSDIELADEKPDYWAVMDVSAFKGKTATFVAGRLAADSKALELIEQGDAIKDSADLYNEKLRPQIHFSQKRGWNNDPNGMVFYDGEWHLFFQHNPYGWKWANMHWGHAVSRDLMHWEELPTALYPWTQAKAHCFSGSAAVDWNNTGGFQKGNEKTLIAMFTDTGCGEAIAYSNDKGRTWTYFEGNPVIKHKGRDPKLFWYAPGKHWVSAVYDEEEGKRSIAFYSSADLKTWTLGSKIDGYFECPELFELPVDGDKGNTRWVIFAADAKYAVGKFDGKTFVPEHEGKHTVHHGYYYASQTFTDAPDGRRIQIGWAKIETKDMPFNQTMSIPSELSLRKTSEGIRLFVKPVKEIEKLHGKKHLQENVVVTKDKPLDIPAAGDLFEIRLEIEPGSAKSFSFAVGAKRLVCDFEKLVIERMPLAKIDGKLKLQVLVDRPMWEVCVNDGQSMFTTDSRPYGQVQGVKLSSEGDVKVTRVEVIELKSIWR